MGWNAERRKSVNGEEEDRIKDNDDARTTGGKRKRVPRTKQRKREGERAVLCRAAQMQVQEQGVR